MMNIGYSLAVKAVYTTHLKDKDSNDFLDYAKGNIDVQTLIKRRIERFRDGQMNFEFVEYFSVNPSLSFDEIREMGTTAYEG